MVIFYLFVGLLEIIAKVNHLEDVKCSIIFLKKMLLTSDLRKTRFVHQNESILFGSMIETTCVRVHDPSA